MKILVVCNAWEKSIFKYNRGLVKGHDKIYCDQGEERGKGETLEESAEEVVLRLCAI